MTEYALASLIAAAIFVWKLPEVLGALERGISSRAASQPRYRTADDPLTHWERVVGMLLVALACLTVILLVSSM